MASSNAHSKSGLAISYDSHETFLKSYETFLLIRFAKLSKLPSTSDYVDRFVSHIVQELTQLGYNADVWRALLRDTKQQTCQTVETHRACVWLVGASPTQFTEKLGASDPGSLAQLIKGFNKLAVNDAKVMHDTDSTLCINLIPASSQNTKESDSWNLASFLVPETLHQTHQAHETATVTTAPSKVPRHSNQSSDEDTSEDLALGAAYSRQPTSISEMKKPKFRTALDVYNRFVWDDSFNVDDILIGWEDRHSGIWATGLRTWSREITAENFIPMHRVRFFTKMSDGTTLWDRRSKVDRVFQSI
ncbi:MAG: hypothetical protein M1828_004997 [Chrysothrix sp. TS-e1954]|nr:MAG: hypothetical protein M1828_004997 [Chrysothrix sp. TS-e1954]